MSKHFYSHLIELESLTVELDSVGLSEHERIQLAQLVDSSLHHTILEAIFAELSEEEKLRFLDHLASDDHNKIWEHLNEKTENIEDKIKQAAESLKEQLHKDIKDAKRLHKKGVK